MPILPTGLEERQVTKVHKINAKIHQLKSSDSEAVDLGTVPHHRHSLFPNVMLKQLLYVLEYLLWNFPGKHAKCCILSQAPLFEIPLRRPLRIQFKIYPRTQDQCIQLKNHKHFQRHLFFISDWMSNRPDMTDFVPRSESISVAKEGGQGGIAPHFSSWQGLSAYPLL